MSLLIHDMRPERIEEIGSIVWVMSFRKKRPILRTLKKLHSDYIHTYTSSSLLSLSKCISLGEQGKERKKVGLFLTSNIMPLYKFTYKHCYWHQMNTYTEIWTAEHALWLLLHWQQWCHHKICMLNCDLTSICTLNCNYSFVSCIYLTLPVLCFHCLTLIDKKNGYTFPFIN